MCGGTQVRGSHRCAGTGERDTGAGPPLTGSDSNAKQRVVLGDKVSDLSSAESPGATLVSRRSQRPLAWRASVPGHRNRGGAQWCGGFEYNSLCDTCQTMLSLLILLSHLPTVTLAFPHCTRSLEDSGYAGEEVFTSKEEANFFIGRRLLYNRFDLELFTPGDLERECYEEICNYEEAREIFMDEDKMMTFWQDYSIKGPSTKPDGNREKVDVMGLLTGLIAAGVFLVIFGLFGYYLCITKCNRQSHLRMFNLCYQDSHRK
ncbi:transmembrane gamma-carboxyglutamic acid protein 4 isoform X2 [Castor canadensis]|uniref:Transmembrane gamma-carboxyglutamic acid protein 4 isoform X2 n=1 Tax=Castor canadensis TaxID=51338 RepID=A0AC58K5L9_CASCN